MFFIDLLTWSLLFILIIATVSTVIMLILAKYSKKFRRALAALLRDELLEYIGYNHSLPLSRYNEPYIIQNAPLDILRLERVIDFSDPVKYEYDLEKTKREFAEIVNRNITIESESLTSNEDFRRRKVKMMLLIGNPRKN